MIRYSKRCLSKKNFDFILKIVQNLEYIECAIIVSMVISSEILLKISI